MRHRPAPVSTTAVPPDLRTFTGQSVAEWHAWSKARRAFHVAHPDAWETIDRLEEAYRQHPGQTLGERRVRVGRLLPVERIDYSTGEVIATS